MRPSPAPSPGPPPPGALWKARGRAEPCAASAHEVSEGHRTEGRTSPAGRGGGSQAGAGGEGRHRGAVSRRGRPASLFPCWFLGAHPPARPGAPRERGWLEPLGGAGRRGARGHLPGPARRRLRRTRGRSPPGPGAVAARLPALASPGRGPAAAAHGPPHPGTRARPAPGPTERGRRQGARASPPRAPGRPPALRAPRAGRPWPWGPRGLSRRPPAQRPGTRPTHLRRPGPSAHLPAGRRRGRRLRWPGPTQQVMGGERLPPRGSSGAVAGIKRSTRLNGLQDAVTR